MKKQRMVKTVGFLFIFIIAASIDVFSFSDQTTTERILRENKRFVEFLDVCITNFAESRKEDFRKAYEKHFNADVAYLQSDYKRAYKRIYSSQGELENIYRDVVKNLYLEDSKSILDKLAPGIIRSKNARARLYLTLGYRDRTVSWTHFVIADNSNPKLFSYKLYKYEEAIKMARRAKRFAFLALFESQNIESKRKIYNQLCKNEKGKNNPYMNRFLDLDDEAYIKEMGISFEEFEEQQDKLGKDGSGKGTDGKEDVFEKKVEMRVRFRNETKTAKYLINGDFDQAEDIMRKYIDDFNYKLIEATFEVLSANENEASKSANEKLGYDNFKIHLIDNYSRLSKNSVLDSFLDNMKVEDDIKETGKEDTEGPDNTEKNKDSETDSNKGN